ncbi:MAG: hypothetical protein ACRCW0_05190 [Clostridium sp.]
MSKYRGVYIRNIEAVDILKYMYGDIDNYIDKKTNEEVTKKREYIKSKWTGYIPFSLELLKLKNIGMEILKKGITTPIEFNDFIYGSKISNNKSLDIVNINFTTGYKMFEKIKEDEEFIVLNKELNSIKKIRDGMNKKIVSCKNKIKYKEKKHITEGIEELEIELKNLFINRQEIYKKIDDINIDIDECKAKYSLNCEKIRNILYKNGFYDIDGTKFVLYKRSGSKARQGKVMFIKEKLNKEMLSWGRMNIDFPKDEKIDIVGLGAYSSLVSSAIEDTIKINPDNILIVEDIEEGWDEDCKLIYKNKCGDLDVMVKKVEDKCEGDTNFLSASPTDGSCLLDKSYFEQGVDFKLLRNHMFKSCGFKTNIQLFYKDYCNEHSIDYYNFKVKDMFGNKMYAKDVKLICTPSSLKALKFSKYVDDGTDAAMFNYWKDIVKEDDCTFGVCKHNHSSKWEFDGLEYNQMSYQMINSMPLTYNDLIKLTKWEVQYVGKLKTDIEEFVNYLELKKSKMNCNEVMIAILNKNPNFANTEWFRDFRTLTISKYVNKLKSGKIKNIGDYTTMVANPISYLKQSIGIYDPNNIELEGNEIYTKLFDIEKELICFRNPHTSQANVYIAKNTYSKEVERYCNFGRNIVVVNAIKNSICQIMSGADFDSDNCLIYDNETLIKAGKECYKKYLVCENMIAKSSKKEYLNNESMSLVDNTLAKSKMTIGSVVNLGQLLMSEYWTMKGDAEKYTAEDLMKQQKLIDIANILNGMCIDNAKKSFDVDIVKEINKLQKEEYEVRERLFDCKKPLFWRYVSREEKLKTAKGRKAKLIKYNTTMDILQDVLDENIPKLNGTNKGNTIKLQHILDKNLDKAKADRKTENKILEIVEGLDKQIKASLININAGEDEDSKNDLIRDAEIEVEEALKEYKGSLNKNTIIDILLAIDGIGQSKKVERIGKLRDRLISFMYSKSPKNFIDVFEFPQKNITDSTVA